MDIFGREKTPRTINQVDCKTKFEVAISVVAIEVLNCVCL